jgi:hypothetical protein
LLIVALCVWGTSAWDETLLAHVLCPVESLILLVAIPIFILRMRRLAHANLLWVLWGVFCAVWLLASTLRTWLVRSEPCQVNEMDTPFARRQQQQPGGGGGVSCEQLIAVGAGNCAGNLGPNGQFAHSCDKACGFVCDACDASVQEVVSALTLVRLAHPILYVSIAVSARAALRRAQEEVEAGNEAMLERERYSVWGGSE